MLCCRFDLLVLITAFDIDRLCVPCCCNWLAWMSTEPKLTRLFVFLSVETYQWKRKRKSLCGTMSNSLQLSSALVLLRPVFKPSKRTAISKGYLSVASKPHVPGMWTVPRLTLFLRFSACLCRIIAWCWSFRTSFSSFAWWLNWCREFSCGRWILFPLFCYAFIGQSPIPARYQPWKSTNRFSLSFERLSLIALES